MSARTNSTPRTARLGIGRIVVAGLLAVAAGVVAPAWAQGAPGGPGMGGHPMMGGPGMGDHGMMWGDPARLGRMADHMLDGLNASDAQRSQIKQIAQAAAADLKVQRDAGRALHEKGLQLFAAPTEDVAAVEALRQQMLAQHDQASKRMMQAMIDVAKVLTPEQRAKLAERIKLRGDMMRDRLQRMQQGPAQKS